jgi:hypothetical protein
MGVGGLTATARVPSPSLRRSNFLFQSLTRRRKMMFSVVPKSSADVEKSQLSYGRTCGEVFCCSKV